MKRKLFDIITALTVMLGIVPLSSCGDTEENFTPEYFGEYESTETPEPEKSPVPAPAAAPGASSLNLIAETAAEGGVPELTNRSENDKDRLTFTADNIFAQGEYYTVSVTGEKSADKELDDTNTYVRGELYGNFRLVLEKDGAELDRLEIRVPRDDKLLIMDSVADGLTYGFGVISNKRDFLTDNYPDIVQLEFYKLNDNELPQYARYFAVFDSKLAELPVYENGAECEPRGTHPELRGEGRMVQHLCVYTPSGKSLMVTKYEYIFDVENRRLNKREIDFLGWNVDN